MSALRRVGAIGDIHAESDRLEKALGFLESRELDGILCVGDIVDGLGCVDRCCQLLGRFHVSTVMGNHDRWFLEGANRDVENASSLEEISDPARAFLESLPKTVSLETIRGTAMLCHGLREHDMASVRPSDTLDEIYNNLELWAVYRDERIRFVFNGHTHRHHVRVFRHLTVVNAGCLLSNAESGISIVDFEDGHVAFYALADDGGVRLAGQIGLAGACPR